MKVHKGKHVTWREISLRIAKGGAVIERPFIELNLWKWFIGVSWDGKVRTK